VTISPAVATLIRDNNAVVVIHGIDYDGSGTYDNVLGPSDLAPQFTGDSTAPALCGHLAAPQTAASIKGSQPTVYTASLTRTSLAGSDLAGGSALQCHVPASGTNSGDRSPVGDDA